VRAPAWKRRFPVDKKMTVANFRRLSVAGTRRFSFLQQHQNLACTAHCNLLVRQTQSILPSKRQRV
jgi:hypothetical protein